MSISFSCNIFLLKFSFIQFQIDFLFSQNFTFILAMKKILATKSLRSYCRKSWFFIVSQALRTNFKLKKKKNRKFSSLLSRYTNFTHVWMPIKWCGPWSISLNSRWQGYALDASTPLKPKKAKALACFLYVEV